MRCPCVSVASDAEATRGFRVRGKGPDGRSSAVRLWLPVPAADRCVDFGVSPGSGPLAAP